MDLFVCFPVSFLLIIKVLVNWLCFEAISRCFGWLAAPSCLFLEKIWENERN